VFHRIVFANLATIINYSNFEFHFKGIAYNFRIQYKGERKHEITFYFKNSK